MASFPATFKQAVFTTAGGPLTIQEAPLVPPGPNEVLVKVEACGVCHSDLGVQHNAFGVGFPMTPGHEVIGRVAAVGTGAEKWKVGDRIGAGWHGGYDGTCGACKKGLFQMCDNQPITGVTRNGGYAEYVLVRSEAGVRVPDEVDAAKYAPLLCAGVTVFNAMRQMNVPPGSTVAVQGLGGLGHLGVQYAAKFGYRVVALSRGADKEAFARQLGAHEYVDTTKGDAGVALKALGGADLIVVTSPDVKGIPELLNGLAPVGKLLVLSVPSEPVPINIVTLLLKGLSVHSWPVGHAVDMEETIQFSELQGVDCMIEKFPLEKANEAYDAMLKGSVRFRAVLTFE
ncbi:chaperonin 10-like protein [Staphylotrichum tortipilum]|uniref:Chaperonin 10-like protein n=1 Tax=Staphylotrichum tortipilum TaxID=2831512 RepID=A0AAN6RWD6_9PEZI|nr:chaperonin 10-like protein [Staphylotrichum longicolle]